MNKSLYDILGYKAKHSVLKSVFVTNKIFENCLIVNVEAYDDTGYRALNTSVSNFDRFTDYLDKIIDKHFSKIHDGDAIRVCIYGLHPVEYIRHKEGD